MLAVAQLVKKSFAFHGTRRFTAVLTRAHHLTHHELEENSVHTAIQLSLSKIHRLPFTFTD
jgi:hypothetical protein